MSSLAAETPPHLKNAPCWFCGKKGKEGRRYGGNGQMRGEGSTPPIPPFFP